MMPTPVVAAGDALCEEEGDDDDADDGADDTADCCGCCCCVVGVGGEADAADGFDVIFTGDVDTFVGDSFDELCDVGNIGLSGFALIILYHLNIIINLP